VNAPPEPEAARDVSPAMTTPRMAFDTPCDADLDAMPSFDRGRRRFCSQCMRSVHMLSEMTRSEAQAFIEQNHGACMSYRRGADGRLVFRAEQPRPEQPVAAFVPRARLSVRPAAAAAPVLAVLAGCTAPLETPEPLEDEQAELLVAGDTETYPGYQAVPEQHPCDPPPVEEVPPRGNNELLDGNMIPELGKPGHYAGGLSIRDIELPSEVPAGPSQLRLASVKAEGIDEILARRIVRQHVAPLRSCLERSGLTPGRDELELRFVIDATGKVLGARAKLDHGGAVPCVVEEVQAWSFPEPDSPSASVVVRYRLV
jgi:hypothetical protein